MTDKARAARARYMREYRRKHPEKQREYAERHWERVAEKLETENAEERGDD